MTNGCNHSGPSFGDTGASSEQLPVYPSSYYYRRLLTPPHPASGAVLQSYVRKI